MVSWGLLWYGCMIQILPQENRVVLHDMISDHSLQEFDKKNVSISLFVNFILFGHILKISKNVKGTELYLSKRPSV